MLCYVTVCYFMLCYGMVWYGMVWYGMYVCMYVSYIYKLCILFVYHLYTMLLVYGLMCLVF